MGHPSHTEGCTGIDRLCRADILYIPPSLPPSWAHILIDQHSTPSQQSIDTLDFYHPRTRASSSTIPHTFKWPTDSTLLNPRSSPRAIASGPSTTTPLHTWFLFSSARPSMISLTSASTSLPIPPLHQNPPAFSISSTTSSPTLSQ